MEKEIMLITCCVLGALLGLSYSVPFISYLHHLTCGYFHSCLIGGNLR